MSPTSLNFTELAAQLNFTELAANAVVPASGINYQVVNLAFAHYLDNTGGITSDGNPVAVLDQSNPGTSQQIWSYLTYPSTNGDTIFSLQSLSTLQSGGNSIIDGRGGYLRVDQTTNRAVQGGQPQAWKLIQVAPSIYKMAPFENFLSSNGRLVATDGNPTIQGPTANQVQLQQDISSLQQFWTFN